ncbi:zinc finger, CCHC-type containing protein [Tanacetum coccineum]
MDVDGTIEKFKARLVIWGIKQNSGMDYFDTYEPVAPFLNSELDGKVYINQPQASSSQGMKTRKFNVSSKGFIICLYVDDMLIFGTDQVQIDLTEEILSPRFSMKDIGEADVILGYMKVMES